MKSTTKIILLIILLVTDVALALIFRSSRLSPLAILSPSKSPTVSQPVPYESQDNEGGEVTVSVTPLTLRPGFPPSFDVAFETHSVDLAFDVEQIATLTDKSGTVYTPHWDGTPAGGHHRSGTLRFTPDLAGASSLTLTFKDIAGVPTRTFTWGVSR